MRSVYLVTYDVCDPKRLRQTFRIMRRYGDHLQLSVFRCILGDREKIRMISNLKEVLNSKEDQVLIVELGPEEGRGMNVIETIGLAYMHPERHAVVV
ncbi:MAG: CRISPR-associated endonuclease Cas2 [Myxococcales bacterium]|jgi:CRISPR-associated protein Cas2|nr:CRISPR-associated endonuclease Cas2 [Myxococcales bacterium]